jgi:hypothetical protein
VLGRQAVLEIREKLDELLGKVVRHGVPAVPLQGIGGLRVASRRAAEPEIDAVGVEAGEHGKSLGNLERAVMRQHHTAAPDPDALRPGCYRADQRLG